MLFKNKRLIGYVLAVVAVVACVATIVANSISRAPTPRPTSTPQEQVRNLYQAILNGDQSAFLSCFAITGSGQQAFLESEFSLARAGMKFRALVTKKYGEGAWDRLQKPAKNDDGVEFHASVSAPTAQDFKALESLPEPTSEDSYSYSGLGAPLEIRRTNGWLAVIPPGDYGQATKLMQRMRSTIDTLTEKLESDEMPFETLHKNFNTEMASAFGFTMKKSTPD